MLAVIVVQLVVVMEPTQCFVWQSSVFINLEIPQLYMLPFWCHLPSPLTLNNILVLLISFLLLLISFLLLFSYSELLASVLSHSSVTVFNWTFEVSATQRCLGMLSILRFTLGFFSRVLGFSKALSLLTFLIYEFGPPCNHKSFQKLFHCVWYRLGIRVNSRLHKY